jgi:hypothetical protein
MTIEVQRSTVIACHVLVPSVACIRTISLLLQLSQFSVSNVPDGIDGAPVTE